jgi:1,2-phenylacetyl-CoA epoxidase PaaB subunit
MTFDVLFRDRYGGSWCFRVAAPDVETAVQQATDAYVTRYRRQPEADGWCVKSAQEIAR